MNNPFSNLERLERELSDIALQITRVHFSYYTADVWRPAINAYRCIDRFVVCVDLAGMQKRGGLKEKILAAERAGVKTVIIPKLNETDLLNVPGETKEKLAFVVPETVDQVLVAAIEVANVPF
jgi:hypothetical protein